jgi:hypothetical protein
MLKKPAHKFLSTVSGGVGVGQWHELGLLFRSLFTCKLIATSTNPRTTPSCIFPHDVTALFYLYTHLTLKGYYNMKL